MIFSKRKSKQPPAIFLNGEQIEVVYSFNYLGIMLNYNGSFRVAKTKLIEQASKAMYSIFKNARRLSLTPDLQLKLFDSLVSPILLYCCEVWGFEDLSAIEKVHLNFCKRILNVKRNTPSCMVYGDLGRVPLKGKIYSRIIRFWKKILVGKECKLSFVIYSFLYDQCQKNIFKSKWIQNTKSILDQTGNSFIWLNHDNVDISVLSKIIEQNICDQFIAQWHHDIEVSSKTFFYRFFKHGLNYENYLNTLSNSNRILLTKFRLCNHKLPIETGRWLNLPRNDRLCTLCTRNCIGDEYHFLLECSSLNNIRKNTYPLISM